MRVEKSIHELISESKKVLVFGHLGPDPDCVGSVLFTTNIINNSYDGVEAVPVFPGGLTESLRFLTGTDNIVKDTVEESIEKYNPDLLIALDGSDPKRFTNDADNLMRLVKNRGIKVIVIDHHKSEDSSDIADIYINNLASCTTQELYRIFVDELKIETYPKYYNELGVGLLGDTGRFLYSMEDSDSTLEFFNNLLKAGFVVEEVVNLMGVMKEKELKALGKLVSNIVVGDRYTYTYITREDVDEIALDAPNLKKVTHIVVDNYVRYTVNRWGFLMYPDIFDPEKKNWRISFRSSAGVVNTICFSSKLNGGGHILASGAEVRADNHNVALEQIFKVIDENIEEAKSTI